MLDRGSWVGSSGCSMYVVRDGWQLVSSPGLLFGRINDILHLVTGEQTGFSVVLWNSSVFIFSCDFRPKRGTPFEFVCTMQADACEFMCVFSHSLGWAQHALISCLGDSEDAFC